MLATIPPVEAKGPVKLNFIAKPETVLPLVIGPFE